MGYGAGVTVTGQGLSLTSVGFQFGLGLGGGLAIDPKGGPPDPNAPSGSNSIGWFGQAGIGVGAGAWSLDAGIAGNYGGTQTLNSNGFPKWQGYGDVDSTSTGSRGADGLHLLKGGAVGVEAGLSVGVEVTHNFGSQ